MDNSPNNRPEQLIAAVLHLMSHYTTQSVLNKDQRACVKLAAVIERHLTILSELPDLGPVLRATCGQLSEQWTQVVDISLTKPVRPAAFLRWANS